MKKFFQNIGLVVGLSVASSVSAGSLSYTATVAPGGTTGASIQIPLALPGSSATVNYILMSAPTSAASEMKFYDTPSTNLTYTVGAYSNIVSYATNWITTYTNYYGATNSLTNFDLVDVTNSVAATTVSYPLIYDLTIASTNTTTFSSLNQRFLRGITVTNITSNPITITVNYTQ